MGSFSSGVLSGLTEIETERAKSSARWSAVEADDAKREARRANGRYEDMAAQVKQQKADADRFFELSQSNAVGVIGCRRVIAAMIAVMQEMPLSQREVFRDKLVQISRREIAKFDADPEHRAQGLHSVEKEFQRYPENKILGIV